MKWTLQSGNNPSEFQLFSDDGNKVTFKYSRSQQSIRMRFNENYGVYVLDEGSFAARKFAIRNVYGSEIGVVTKGSWRETTGTLLLNEFSKKMDYLINVQETTIEITMSTSLKSEVKVMDPKAEENYMLALIVFSWMQSVTALHLV